MLLVKTRLGPSEIHGLGVYTAEPVPAGQRVWEFTHGFDQACSPEVLETLTPVQQMQFLRYSYLDSRTREYICCADDGRFMNHSGSPNTVEFYASPDDRYGGNVAVCDIAEGEELTCDYFSFDLEASAKLDGNAQPTNDDSVEGASIRPTHYLHHGLTFGASESARGKCLVAASPIRQGTVVAVWGGEVYTEATFLQLDNNYQRHSVQVEEALYLVPPNELGPADCFNHSCDPNLGLQGQICLVALRDIQAGEEVCYDYAMTDGSPYDEFECRCGTGLCRGQVTANDWQRADLQERYQTHFSTYLLRRMGRLA